MTQDFTNVNATGLTDQGAYTPDKLFDRDTQTRKLTVLSGQGVLGRGSLMGKITKGSATSAVKASGANTGNGTFVIDATTPVLANAHPGIYTLRCVVAVTNGGTFELKDPDGAALGRYDITGGAGGTVTVADRIKGVLTDASTDFIVGDGFDITVAAGSSKYKLSVPTAVDGSEVPDAILLENIDATSSDKDAAHAISGSFAIQGIVFGAGHTAASVDAVLRTKDIYLTNVIG